MTPRLSNGRLLGWLTAAVATAAVVTSIWLHPPSEMRARRLDEVRMQSMYQTEMAIQSYYSNHHSLPATLNLLDTEGNHHIVVRWRDPETGLPFEYAITGEMTYNLCAVFARNSDPSDITIGIDRTHNRGRDCFQQNVNPPRSFGGS
jgi:hypothetical protein